MDEKTQILKSLVDVLNAYEGATSLISNQGQALDGYSALASFLDIARKAKNYLENKETD